MPHHTPLIETIVAGIGLAFLLGALANRLRRLLPDRVAEQPVEERAAAVPIAVGARDPVRQPDRRPRSPPTLRPPLLKESCA